MFLDGYCSLPLKSGPATNCYCARKKIDTVLQAAKKKIVLKYISNNIEPFSM